MQSACLFEQLIDNHLRINITSRLYIKKASPSDGFPRPATSLEHQVGRRVFWEGSKILSYVQSGL